MKKTEYKEHMGIGPKGVGDPNAIFARKFRWTLQANHLDSYWMKSVSFDWKNKLINCSAYEVLLPPGVVPVVEWLENFNTFDNEKLEFKTWDGCGVAIYSYIFSGLRLEKNKSDFDYASSDISTRNFTVSYETVKFDTYERQETPKLTIEEQNERTEELVKKWSFTETVINFLNDRMYLPARVFPKRKQSNK